jgi:putative peptidoglycan lipid II flippase
LFSAAAFAPALNNIVVIGVLFIFTSVAPGPRSVWVTVEHIQHHTGLLWLIGAGTTAGIVAMALVLVPPMIMARIPLRPVFDWKNRAVIQMLRLSGWTVGYVIANQIALAIVLILATGPRDVASYLYAYMFFQLPYGLFAVSLMTTVTPELARSANAHDFGELRYRFDLGLRYLLVGVLPASVAFMVLAQPIVGILVRGGFGAADAHVTADTLQMFAVGLVPFCVYLYALRGFYALQDTRTPFLINCVENALNVAFAIALYPRLGVQGLALSFSAAYAISSVGALVMLYRRVGHGHSDVQRQTRSVATRCLIASVALGFVAWPIAGAIGSAGAAHAAAAAIVAGGIAGLVYLAVLRLLGVTEIATIVGLLLHRPEKARADV